MAHDTCGDFFGIAGLTGDLISLPLHGERPIGQSSPPLCDCDMRKQTSPVVRLVYTLLPVWVARIFVYMFCTDYSTFSPLLSSSMQC
jgi:hypothetical protein